jgi:hypothetical protein
MVLCARLLLFCLPLVSFIGVPRVSAECILIPVKHAKPQAAIVFEGTVREVVRLANAERAATLTVHRVWKGEVAPEITVYFRGRLTVRCSSLASERLCSPDRRRRPNGEESESTLRIALGGCVLVSPSRERMKRPCVS